MRKWIWGGLALAVVGAAGFSLAVARLGQPDSWMIQVSESAGRLAVRCNPLTVLNRRHLQEPAQGCCHQDESPCHPAPRNQVEVVEPIVVEIFPSQGLEWNFAVLDLDTPPLFQLPPGPEMASAQTQEPESLDPFEESEFIPFLPRTIPDDGPEPPVAEEPVGAAGGPIAPCAFRCGTKCPNIQVEIDLPCLVGFFQVLTRCLNACVEGNVDSTVPIGIDFDIPSPVLNRRSPIGEEEAEYLETDLPVGHPAMERCLEDPGYHHHYPGCPYTGHCPAPFHVRMIPEVPPARPNMAMPIQPKPVPQLPGLEEADLEDEEATQQSSLDTLECRPSDLLQGFEQDGPI